MRPKAVLLDRDGVINVDLPQSVRHRGEFCLIPGVVEGIARLSSSGYLVAIVTNQACVGRGDTPISELEAMHASLCGSVKSKGGVISAIECCFDLDPKCQRRKPNPGMINALQQALGFVPGSSWMVGDSLVDVDAAEAAGCRPVLVRTGKGEMAVSERTDVINFGDLPEFVEWLLTDNQC